MGGLKVRQEPAKTCPGIGVCHMLWAQEFCKNDSVPPGHETGVAFPKVVEDVQAGDKKGVL
jgi:hypothetical protein